MISGLVILILSILGGAFIGPCVNMLTTENSSIKNLWSFPLRLLTLIPLVALEYFTSGKQEYIKTTKLGLTRKNVLAILITPVFQLIWQWGGVYGM